MEAMGDDPGVFLYCNNLIRSHVFQAVQCTRGPDDLDGIDLFMGTQPEVDPGVLG